MARNRGDESEGSARLRSQSDKAQDEAHFRRCWIEWLPVVALLGGSGDETSLAASFRSVDYERIVSMMIHTAAVVAAAATRHVPNI